MSLKRNNVFTKTKTTENASASISVRRSILCNRYTERLRLNERGYTMKRSKLVAMICCFVFVVLAFTPQVKADEFNKKTILTFSEPFEVPGVVAQILPAGKYVFKIVDV